MPCCGLSPLPFGMLWVDWNKERGVISLTRFSYVYICILHQLYSVSKNYLEPSDTTHSFSGGSPYPRLKGQEIAQMLQGGYRMSKPQHVGQRL